MLLLHMYILFYLNIQGWEGVKVYENENDSYRSQITREYCYENDLNFVDTPVMVSETPGGFGPCFWEHLQ